MDVKFSRTLAIIFGVLLPLLGIVRNWTTPKGDAAGFFVDLAAGGMLLYGVWRVAEKERSGQRFLAAGWGLTVGLIYASLEQQVEALYAGTVAEAPIPAEWSVALTAFGLLLSIVGLVSGLRSTKKH